MVTLDEELRKIAKSSHWQSLYSASKELATVGLFDNTTNLSGCQVRFLYWLRVYDMLYSELARFEDVYLTQAVIDDYGRTDSYLIYRKHKHDYEWKEHRKNERDTKMQNRNPNRRNSGSSGKRTNINVDLRRE